MGEWKSAKYPDGCNSCGTLTKTHIGRGLCSTCYQREARHEQDFESVGTTDTDVGAVDMATSSSGRSDLSQALEEPLGTSGEVRPGSGGSTSVPPDPGEPTPSKRRRFWERNKPTQPEATAPVTPERRPGKRTPSKLGRRQSSADTLEDILGGVGALAVRSGKHLPLGRYLQFSAPVNAEILDDAIAGTMIDRVAIQPLVKGRGRFDALGAVLGPPAIILAIENDPSKAPVLIPILKTTLRNSLPAMAKAAKKVQAKEAAAQKAAEELFPDLAPGEDPADAIIAMLFDGWSPPAPVTPEAQPEPEPEVEAA